MDSLRQAPAPHPRALPARTTSAPPLAPSPLPRGRRVARGGALRADDARACSPGAGSGSPASTSGRTIGFADGTRGPGLPRDPGRPAAADRPVRPRRGLPAPGGARPRPRGVRARERAAHAALRRLSRAWSRSSGWPTTTTASTGVSTSGTTRTSPTPTPARLWRVLALVSDPGSIDFRVLAGLRRDDLLADPLRAVGFAPLDPDSWWRVVATSPPGGEPVSPRRGPSRRPARGC